MPPGNGERGREWDDDALEAWWSRPAPSGAPPRDAEFGDGWKVERDPGDLRDTDRLVDGAAWWQDKYEAVMESAQSGLDVEQGLAAQGSRPAEGTPLLVNQYDGQIVDRAAVSVQPDRRTTPQASPSSPLAPSPYARGKAMQASTWEQDWDGAATKASSSRISGKGMSSERLCRMKRRRSRWRSA